MRDDIADALRFASNIAGEEPGLKEGRYDLKAVRIDFDVVYGIVDGYLQKMEELYGPSGVGELKEEEEIIERLEQAAYVQCCRFLEDALIGNQYYRIGDNAKYADLNLFRAEGQMQFLEQLEGKKPQLIAYLRARDGVGSEARGDEPPATVMTVGELEGLTRVYVQKALARGQRIVTVLDLDKDRVMDNKSPLDAESAQLYAEAIKQDVLDVVLLTMKGQDEVDKRVMHCFGSTVSPQTIRIL